MPNDGQRQASQRRRSQPGVGDQVEGAADVDLDVAVEEVVEDRSQQRGQWEMRIAHQVRQDPAHRPLAVVAMLVLEPEFALGHG